jgi:hypothetical protein
MSVLDGFMFGIYMLATAITLCACSTVFETKEMPHPDTGKMVQATVSHDKFLGITLDTDIKYPKVPKSGKDISNEAKEKFAKIGTYCVIAGIGMAVVGVVLSIAVSTQLTRVPQLLCGGLLIGGACTAGTGLLLIGLAMALAIVLPVVVIAVIGFILYLARNKGLKKWPLTKSGSKERS